METCYYCKLNPAINNPEINPYHGEAHPTCALCSYDFGLKSEGRKKYSYLNYPFWIVVISVIALWQFVGEIAAGASFVMYLISKYMFITLSGKYSSGEKIVTFAKKNGLAMIGDGNTKK